GKFFTYAAPHFAEFFRFRARDPWKVRIVILKNRFCRQSQAKAELGEANNLTKIQNKLLDKIGNVIDGIIEYRNDSFYTKKKNGERIEFPLEAEGFRKFGLLWKLLKNGLFEKGSILFWDEPEANINPELMSVLVDVLLELARNNVQIFIATHSEILANFFSVNMKKNDKVMFYSLFKDKGQIDFDSNDRFDLLNPNKLTEVPVRIYEKRLDKVFGDE
ncbi:MAG: ATP-binding protein, partial [Gracilibacteraceae bacterium]|nr:ATP-binding protein [Gracilibacteraceae bacterium]